MKSGMDIESSSISSTTPFMNMTPREMVTHLASSNAVVVFSSSDCCFSTVAKNLLFSLAVGPLSSSLIGTLPAPPSLLPSASFLVKPASHSLPSSSAESCLVVWKSSWPNTSMAHSFLYLRKLELFGFDYLFYFFHVLVPAQGKSI